MVIYYLVIKYSVNREILEIHIFDGRIIVTRRIPE